MISVYKGVRIYAVVLLEIDVLGYQKWNDSFDEWYERGLASKYLTICVFIEPLKAFLVVNKISTRFFPVGVEQCRFPERFYGLG